MASLRCVLVLAIIMVQLAGCNHQGGDSPKILLRYTYQSGDLCRVCISRHSEVVALSGGKQTREETDCIVNELWEVSEVNDNGTAEIRVSIERIRLNVTSPSGNIKIDTDIKKGDELYSAPPTVITELMNKAKIIFSVDSRGQIINVDTDEIEITQLASLYHSASKMLTKKGLMRTLKQMMPVFPESPVGKGDAWEDNLELNRPGDDRKIRICFRYTGRDMYEGSVVEKITTAALFESSGEAVLNGIPAIVARQDISGEIYFDSRKGRLMGYHNSEERIVQCSEERGGYLEVYEVDTNSRFEYDGERESVKSCLTPSE